MVTLECIAYFNETSRFNAYTPGDKLTASKLGLMTVEVDDGAEIEGDLFKIAADKLFAKLNRDDRPNGAFERSLSVGDVIVVELPTPCCSECPGWVTKRLACEPVGWKVV